jgi:2-oxo-3-hexenedioate decarboxylase/2-keto-4-pentenoate hydratase
VTQPGQPAPGQPQPGQPAPGQPASGQPAAAAALIASARLGGELLGDLGLGEPLQVLCWLANSCAAWGTPLLAGDIVLLGSLVQTQWVQAGDVVTVTNDPLGEVAADFTA